MSSLAIVNTNLHNNAPTEAPIVSSHNHWIRPLLDTVDRLRNLNVMKEGIQLPTIVVVSYQSSGKSSVLESLAGISLPHGQGICTRVPLVMKLMRNASPEIEIWLKYSDKVVPTDEDHITEAICTATDAIAGSGKGVSDTPLELYVRRESVPDLTMVDLPGITRNPINGQPEDIYEQVSAIIIKYIEPQESIILNVLSATCDFSIYESIRMSKKVDKNGERTLAAVTKADLQPEGIVEKVTADDVSIGLGYVCVRNRVGDETYEEARKQEELLFKTHPLLSKIDENIVGIPVLAQRLVEIQAKMIARCLPELAQKINEKLDNSIHELNKLPTVITSSSEALMTFMNIICSVKESLHRLLIVGDVSDMHSSTRLADMLSKFSYDLQAEPQAATEFLMDEIKIVEMEKLTDYTCNQEYTTGYSRKMTEQGSFISAVVSLSKASFSLSRFGTVPITHLRKYHAELLHQAFDMKIRIKVYWPIVVRRIVDNTALYLQFTLKKLVDSQFQKEIVAELLNHRGGGDIVKMLEESPSVARKREKLKNSIKLLKESKDAVAAIVDQNP
ncbi:unnamed protein product [Brassica napus]|uniref:(rape) hypothetical protein n=1 Tax=Brassica napus TaxID=3708 RepID=A0A816JTV6_BRANA|nr:unnamed protein product [Brassica napus]